MPNIDLSMDWSKFDERNGGPGKKIMSWDQFKKIKQRIHFAIYDETNKDHPWHPLMGLVKGFNDKCKMYIAALIWLLLDETMSSFGPQTTKSSLLPFLSFIFQKPKPLGIEFKTSACANLKIMLGLEIQEGKIPM